MTPGDRLIYSPGGRVLVDALVASEGGSHRRRPFIFDNTRPFGVEDFAYPPE